MPKRCCSLVLGLLASLPFLSAPAGDFFPYAVEKKTLENGLDLLVIETPEFKDVLNFNVLILAGSRNEIEKGKSGLAHLFEHIAFRHKFEDPADSYDTRIEKIGAFDNAWTWFDVTYYHPVTFAENLEPLVKLQAERFVSMEFSERIYRTEAGAVLGEYRRIASDPSLRMEEVLSDLAYGPEHGYGHTTMGYLDDVRAMPDSYSAGRKFYETYYRPNNAVVIVAGDVQADRAFRVLEDAFGKWERAELPTLPEPPVVEGPKKAHVDWESQVAPRINVAHRVPAFRLGAKESAVLLILPELISGETAPLYRRLRYEKQIATSMHSGGRAAQGFDDRLLETELRLDQSKFEAEGTALLDAVELDLAEGFAELARFSAREGAGTQLRAIQSKFRYDLLASLDSPHSISGQLAWYYRFGRNPNVLDEVVESVANLEPVDIDAFSSRHLTPRSRFIVTMASKPAESAAASAEARR